MLTWEQVSAWRMGRQGLVERAPVADALAVVGRICGLHAQVMSSAEMSLWARVRDLPPDWVSRALWEERTLVKTWAMRGTLHLLPAAELALWLGATATYRHYRKPVWLRNFGITEAQLDALCEAVSDALDGPPLTREELAAAVAKRTGDPALGEKARESFGAYLKPAAFQGRLVFAPNEGRNVRFTRPDRWLEPKDKGSDPQHELNNRDEVALRYLGAYGPATREDLGRWWGVSPAEAGRILRGLDVEAVTVDGVEAWVRAGDAAAIAAAEPPGVARLLPAFDPFVVGATRAGLVTPIAQREAVYRPQGWLSPVLCVDGAIAGTWRREQGGIQLAPFAPLPSWAVEQLEAEAESLARFLDAA